MTDTSIGVSKLLYWGAWTQGPEAGGAAVERGHTRGYHFSSCLLRGEGVCIHLHQPLP